MKTIMIVASATAAVFGAYLLMRRRSPKPMPQTNNRQNGNSDKHLTDVFSRAKQHSM